MLFSSRLVPILSFLNVISPALSESYSCLAYFSFSSSTFFFQCFDPGAISSSDFWLSSSSLFSFSCALARALLVGDSDRLRLRGLRCFDIFASSCSNACFDMPDFWTCPLSCVARSSIVVAASAAFFSLCSCKFFSRLLSCDFAASAASFFCLNYFNYSSEMIFFACTPCLLAIVSCYDLIPPFFTGTSSSP